MPRAVVAWRRGARHRLRARPGGGEPVGGVPHPRQPRRGAGAARLPARRGLAGVPGHRGAGRRLRVPHRAARRARGGRGVDHVPRRRRPGGGSLRGRPRHPAPAPDDRARRRRPLRRGVRRLRAPPGRPDRGRLRRREHCRRRRAGRRGRHRVAGPPAATLPDVPHHRRRCGRRGAQDLAHRRGAGRARRAAVHGHERHDSRRAVLPVHVGLRRRPPTRRRTCCARWWPDPTCFRRT